MDDGIIMAYGELTTMPSIEVDSVDGLIENRPLQVAGARMLPAAIFIKEKNPDVSLCSGIYLICIIEEEEPYSLHQ